MDLLRQERCSVLALFGEDFWACTTFVDNLGFFYLGQLLLLHHRVLRIHVGFFFDGRRLVRRGVFTVDVSFLFVGVFLLHDGVLRIVATLLFN